MDRYGVKGRERRKEAEKEARTEWKANALLALTAHREKDTAKQKTAMAALKDVGSAIKAALAKAGALFPATLPCRYCKLDMPQAGARLVGTQLSMGYRCGDDRCMGSVGAVVRMEGR